MKKKIIDISPPQKSSEEKTEKKFEEKVIIGKVSRVHKKRRNGLNFLVVSVIVVGIAVIVYFGGFFLAKLDLYLTPETEKEVFEDEIEVNLSQTTPDFTEKIIPGSFFETEEEKWQKFKATGKDSIEGKAEGMIRVYNSQSPVRSITLRATTRFLSAEGSKIFRAPDKIYLPPASIVGGKVIPSFKDVKVIAQEAGEEYNIGPTKFSVPGLTGTPLYYTVWAESFEPMKGGFKKEILVVSENDLESARDILKKDIKNLAENSLKNQLPEGFVLAEEGSIIDDIEVSCIEKTGEQVPEFNCQGKVKIKALAFRLSDLKNLAMEFIKSRIPPLKDFDSESLSLEYRARNLLGEEGKMILDLKTGVNIYDRISKEILLAQIRGKSEDEIREIVFESYPQIIKAEFKFWPFWVKKAPKSSDRINIEVRP